MDLIIRLLINAITVIVAAYILPGVTVDGFLAALLVAIVLSLANILIKPVLIILTLPLTILSLGLFIFVINALLILLASAVVSGFHVEGFWWALLFSLVMSLINPFLQGATKPAAH